MAIDNQRVRHWAIVGCTAWILLAVTPYGPPLAPHRWPNPYRLWCVVFATAAESALFFVAARRRALGRRLQQASAIFGVALGLVAVSDVFVLLMRLPTNGQALSHINDALEFAYTVAGLVGLFWMPRAPISPHGRRLAAVDTVIAIGGTVLVLFVTTTLVGLSAAYQPERSRIIEYGFAAAGDLIALNLLLVRGLSRPVRGAALFLTATTVLEIVYWVLVQFNLAGLRSDMRLLDVVFAVDQVCYIGAAVAFLTEPVDARREPLTPDWVRTVNPLPAVAVVFVGGLLVHQVMTGQSQNMMLLTIGMVTLSLLLVIRVLIAADDRAELVRRESERTHRLLADRVAALRQMAGGVAHEFNNLLAVIAGNAELAIDDASQNSQVSARLSAIHQSAERGAALTSRLATYAAGGSAATRELLSIDECIGDLQPRIREISGDAIEVVYDLQRDACRLMLNRDLFGQAVVNLVSNASAAMPSGGHLRIATREESMTSLSARHVILPPPPGTYAVLEVSDRGTGMDRQTIDRAFDPFYTTQSHARASGLGLAVVHGAMVAHDGGIAVQSSPGRGTTILLFFPISTRGFLQQGRPVQDQID